MSREIVELERLPELRWANEIAGAVTAEAAAQTGLAEGTPVTVGTSDAAAEAVSVGVTAPGQMMLMYGSTIFFIEVLDQPITDERLWATPYLFEGAVRLACWHGDERSTYALVARSDGARLGARRGGDVGRSG